MISITPIAYKIIMKQDELLEHYSEIIELKEEYYEALEILRSQHGIGRYDKPDTEEAIAADAECTRLFELRDAKLKHFRTLKEEILDLKERAGIS